MRGFFRLVVVAMSISAFGCGGGGSSAPQTPVDSAKERQVNSTADLKKRLEEMAASGSGGSAVLGLKESIDQSVRSSNANLADELMKDVELLQNTTDPAEIKTIATRMAGKL